MFYLGVMVIASCNSGKLTPLEYVHYVQDPSHGLLIKQKIDGVRYDLQYQPVSYLVMLEMQNFYIPQDTFQYQYNRFKGLEHYNLHIYRSDIDSLLKKSKNNISKVEYFDFGIKKDIKLIEGNDTVPCAICECESDGGIYPFYSFTIGFPNKNYKGDRQFLFKGNHIGTEDIKLLVSGSSIKSIPELKTM